MTETSRTIQSSANTMVKHGRNLLVFFVKNSVSANLLMVFLSVGGLVMGFNLKTSFFPTLDLGIISVSVVYPGATPSEVEESITRRVELAVYGINGVEKTSSTASEGIGIVTIELKDFADWQAVKDDVENTIEQIANFPPKDAEAPKIERIEASSGVIILAMTSDLPEREMRKYADIIETDLLGLPDVSQVLMLGARNYEISIEVSESELQRYQLTMAQVANALRRSSLNLSSGKIRTSTGDLLLRSDQKRERGEDFADIVLRSLPDGSVLRLRDIATIRDDFVEEELMNLVNGKPGVLLQVQKSEADDALKIADLVTEFVQSYETPPNVDLSVFNNQSEIIRSRLSLVARNGTLGFALVFLLLVLVLDLRLAVWVAMGVPISFLGALLFFDFFGLTMNMLSLFALIIVLGIVVDDAIVVGENIGAEQEHGLTGADASIAGVQGVFGPVFIGVLTTMAAFAPLFFVPGIFGQILGIVPIVVIIVLSFSLVEAFFILPSHLAHAGTWSRWPLNSIQDFISRAVYQFRDQMLVPAVAVAVQHRYLTLLYGILFLALGLTLLSIGLVRFILFPNVETSELEAQVEFPLGTPFDTTKDAANRIEEALIAVNNRTNGTAVLGINKTIGGSISSGRRPSGQVSMLSASHIAGIRAELHEKSIRTTTANELARMWREEIGFIPGSERLIVTADTLGPGTGVQYELTHQDQDSLEKAARKLEEGLSSIPAFVDIQNSLSLGKRQYDIELTDTGKAAGLTQDDVARQLRQNFLGEEIQRIQRGRNELKVMLRYPVEERRNTNDFFNTRVRLADGTEMPLRIVAKVTESRSTSSITHVNGQRTVSVSASIETKIAPPAEAIKKLQSEVITKLKEDYPGLTINMAGATQQQSEDLLSLGRLSLVAAMLIFVLLASQLRSYAKPFIILAAVPFGATGALIGHFIFGFDLSFVSIFGMIALSGVVVNDSLILIHRYNKIRENSHISAIDAVLEATRRRFRAIFLTTATTALGLTPMLFETSIQAQFLIPMAISLATGIVFASAITLFIVPSLLIIYEDIRALSRAKIWSTRAAA